MVATSKKRRKGGDRSDVGWRSTDRDLFGLLSRFLRLRSTILRITHVKREQEDRPPSRYQRLSHIANGGMGSVYRVRDSVFDRVSAMKEMLPTLVENPDYVERFIWEARITSNLEHPNIVPVHDLGRTPDAGFFYTMKLVEGEALSAILERMKAGDSAYCRKYDRHKRLLIFKKVCDAIAFAHAGNVIHRDIKPENIIVGPYGEVFVMDWGIAKELSSSQRERTVGIHPHDESRPGPRGTLAGALMGTPSYMSPEQASGRHEEVDFRTDVFLLGATLFHVVTLSPPYRGRTVTDCISQAAQGQVCDPNVVCPEEQIPPELCRIIRKAMSREKADRYPTVADLQEELDFFMSGVGIRERIHLEPGEFLFRAEEFGNEGYIILSGKLEVFRVEDGREVRLGVLESGDVVGEMAMLTDETRSANVRAVLAATVERVTSESIKTELNRLGPWVGKVVKSLADRLRSVNTKIDPLLIGPCDWYVAKQIRLLLRASGDNGTQDSSRTWKVDAEKLVREISQNLAIPSHITRTSLEKLVEAGVIRAHGEATLVLNGKRITSYLVRCHPQLPHTND